MALGSHISGGLWLYQGLASNRNINVIELKWNGFGITYPKKLVIVSKFSQLLKY